MKAFDKFSEDFEKIILTSNFSDLSREQLELLEAEGITEDEFHSIKKTLQALESIEEETIAPSDDVKSKLLDLFDEKPQKKGKIISFPFWLTSGISVAALLAIAFFWLKPGADYNQTSTPVAQQITEKEQNEIMNSEESVDNSLDNFSPEESIIQEGEEDEFIKDIPAPEAEALIENDDLPSVSENAAQKTVQMVEEVNFDFNEPQATKEIISNRMVKDEVVEINQIDSEDSGVITKSLGTSTFTTNSALSEITVQANSRVYDEVKIAKKKSYSLAENPSNLNNLVTIY